MKKAPAKNKKVTIDDLKVSIDDLTGLMTRGFEGVYKDIAEVREETNELARMVAKGFENVDKKIEKEIGEVKRDITEVRENLASTRSDILAMGDRFVLKYEFYDLSVRVGLLEQKKKTKR